MLTTDNFVFNYSLGKGRGQGRVDHKKKTWERFKEQFSEPMVDSSITFAKYMALKETLEGRDEQQKLKMSAGYWVPALFMDGRRRFDHLTARTAIVYDHDYITIEQLEYIRSGEAPINEFVWFMHTSRSHCPERPRVRQVIPTNRKMTLEENQAITRLLALYLADDPEEAIEIPDIVSMRPAQIMFLPSISKGQEYWTQENEDGAKILDVDRFLEQHPDWQDAMSWPKQERETGENFLDPNRRAEDPFEKEGIIGAFCRAYSIEDAIAEFLSDIYVPGDSQTDIRYTYTLGTTSNGAVVYDDGRFLHSNHGSDPIEGTANSWDLVRIHLFGHLDVEVHGHKLPGNMPSFKKMWEMASDDDKVKGERMEHLVPDDDWDDDGPGDEDDIDDLLGPPPEPKKKDKTPSIADLLGDDDDEDEPDDLADEFDDDDDDDEPDEKPEKKKNDWTNLLSLDKQDNLEKSLHNCATILKNSKRVAPCIGLNELDGGPYAKKKLGFPKANIIQAPVEDKVEGRRWTDNDTAALMCALAAPRKLDGYDTQFTRQDVELAMQQAAQQNKYNPFLQKVLAVEWDGVPRLATFFHDWFYTEDNAYHAELAISWFVAGITRQYEPGHLYDLVPILGGTQGGGKTGAIKALGMGHMGHLSGDFENTQKMTESTMGKVVLEVPELKGLSKSEIEDVKHYFSATEDTVRLAYRRNPEDFKRRCVYMGTTNQNHYLRDDENRRFCPVLTKTTKWRKVNFKEFIPLVPQFWAEAHVLYLEMRRKQPYGTLPLTFTSKEAKVEAERLQGEVREVMPYEPVQEVIERWLNSTMTEEEVSMAQGRHEIDQEFDDDNDGDKRYVRNLITVTMIRENLGSNPIIRELRGAHADKTIAQALQKLEGWKSLGSVKRLGRRARWYCREGVSSHDEFALVDQQSEIDDILG